MNQGKRLKRLEKLLKTIETVNDILLQLHDLPILAMVNREIRQELKKGEKDENQVQKN